MNNDLQPKQSYTIRIPEGRALTNRQKLEDELDQFWTYAPEIADYEPLGPGNWAGQEWAVRAKEGFAAAWRRENELDLPNRIHANDC